MDKEVSTLFCNDNILITYNILITLNLTYLIYGQYYTSKKLSIWIYFKIHITIIIVYTLIYSSILFYLMNS